MNARHLKRAVAGALAFAATTAFAGQVTLYERPDFQGRYAVANDGMADVANQGLGNTAASIVVSAGRWEVCTDAYFRGRCTELVPGSYPGIDLRLDGRVGSAREIGYATASAPIGRAFLYEDPNFGGAWVAIDRGEANDLDWANFSNPAHRATSIRVESGTWQVCTDLAFRGECRILGPGEYPLLTGSMAAGISSARQVWHPEYGQLRTYIR